MPRGGPREGAGRKENTRNKRKEEMLELIQSHKLTQDYDPLIALSVIANGMAPREFDNYLEILEALAEVKRPSQRIKQLIKKLSEEMTRPVAGIDTLLQANKEVAQYVYSKLRSVELTDPNGENPFQTFLEAVKKKNETLYSISDAEDESEPRKPH